MEPGDALEMVVLSRQQCLARLATTEVGRIGVTMDALPVILPMLFTVVDESVRFGTIEDTRVDTATRGAVIAFQADAYDPTDDGWWSVLLQGIAAPVETIQSGRSGPPTSMLWSGPGTRLLRLDSDNIRGRFFPRTASPSPGAD